MKNCSQQRPQRILTEDNEANEGLGFKASSEPELPEITERFSNYFLSAMVAISSSLFAPFPPVKYSVFVAFVVFAVQLFMGSACSAGDCIFRSMSDL